MPFGIPNLTWRVRQPMGRPRISEPGKIPQEPPSRVRDRQDRACRAVAAWNAHYAFAKLGVQVHFRTTGGERKSGMKYSVVVPFFNERDSVVRLYRDVKDVMEETCDSFEFVFVDDGSLDNTFSLLAEIADQDNRVTVVRLQRNYGKTEALVAGFDHADGDFIIAMDGDLQHNPQEIPLFIQKLEEGYDVVCGMRVARPGDSLLFKRIPSRIGNFLMAKLTGVPIHDFVSGFKAYRTTLIREIPLYGELQRFLPALAATYGARICEIPIHIAERPHGKSHYGLGRAIPFMFDILTIPFMLRYVSRPMHFFGSIGLMGIGLGGALGAWLMVNLLRGVNILNEHGPLLFFTTVLLLAGLVLVSFGLIGEMLVRHHYQKPRALRDSEVLRITKRHRKL